MSLSSYTDMAEDEANAGGAEPRGGERLDSEHLNSQAGCPSPHGLFNYLSQDMHSQHKSL